MKQTKKKRKDFLLILIGQIISLFGNTILRFSLSMKVLDQTGSVAIFGGILALSMIPTILLSAFGGILADRVNKRNVMVILDGLTSLSIVIFAVVFHFTGSILSIAIIMMILSVIQAFYQPSVQSSIPLLVEEKKLMVANGLVIQVNALANLIGPIVGGILYGFFGMEPIVYVSAICFFLSAVMEIFIRIPNVFAQKKEGILATIKNDLGDAVYFLKNKQRELLKLLFLIAGINLVLSAMIMVGLPYLIKIFLGLSNQLYGFAEAAMGIGSILGGLCAGWAVKKIEFKRSYVFLIAAGITILPMAIAVISNQMVWLSYGIILVSVMLIMCFATLFSVYGQTIIQKLTPVNMLGKLSSVVTVISMCALPIGQSIYGVIFNRLGNQSFFILLMVGIVSVTIGMASKSVVKRLVIKS